MSSGARLDPRDLAGRADALERLTAAHRERRAAWLDARAREVKRAELRRWRKEEGGRAYRFPKELERVGRWHASRAEGVRRRFDRVRDCGESKATVRVACKCCSAQQDFPSRCSARVCWKCSKATAWRKQREFMRARLGLEAMAAKLGLYRKRRKGGRWGARLVTLTVPHIDGDLGARVARLRSAWPRFLRELNARWKALGASRDAIGWVRVLEITEGSDGNGHPHFHLWLHSPYLPRGFVADAWRAALRLPEDAPIVVDVRSERGGLDAAKELIKYLVKEIGSDGRVAIDFAARTYIALDGARAFQSSRGFARHRVAKITCEACGTIEPPRVYPLPAPSVYRPLARAQAPPPVPTVDHGIGWHIEQVWSEADDQWIDEHRGALDRARARLRAAMG